VVERAGQRLRVLIYIEWLSWQKQRWSAMTDERRGAISGYCGGSTRFRIKRSSLCRGRNRGRSFLEVARSMMTRQANDST
jgi:hypothetical protein